MKRNQCQMTVYAYRRLSDGTRITYVDTKTYCATQREANKLVESRKKELGSMYAGYAWIQP